ncbi:MAG: lipopolysaccharide biosynthesis protein [Deltaproteobacteria bacterium]|nr:lipopolysaccharide biosynthesis protein [Deltaproteobacteria bacterium]
MASPLIASLRALLPGKGSFAAHALTMMSGTTLAQGLMILSAPVLTRLFTPADFGVFALFVSVTSLLGTVAAGRYELAVLLPGEDGQAANVAALGALISVAVSLICLVGVVWGGDAAAALLGLPGPASWFWLVPLSVLFSGLYQVATYWCTRRRAFPGLAVSRVGQAAVDTAGKVGTGLFTSWGPLGLMGGQLAGQAAALGWLLALFCGRAAGFPWTRLAAADMRRQGRIYWRFPAYDSWAILANSGAYLLPPLLLSHFFDAAVVGAYFLAYRVLNWPVFFLSESLAQLFFQRYEEKRKTGGKMEFLWRMVKLLAALSLAPGLLLLLFAPALFGLVFGAQWVTAGEYLRLMVPIIFFRLVASPLSSVLWAEGRNSWQLAWQATFLAATVGSFLLGGRAGDIHQALIIYSGTASVLYLGYIGLVVAAAKKPRMAAVV